MLPTIANGLPDPEAPMTGVFPRSHPDLTSRSSWALDHITHCPTCGAWELITDHELAARALPTWLPQPWCVHVTPDRVCQ